MLSQREMVIASLIQNPAKVKHPISASKVCANKHASLKKMGWPKS